MCAKPAAYQGGAASGPLAREAPHLAVRHHGKLLLRQACRRRRCPQPLRRLEQRFTRELEGAPVDGHGVLGLEVRTALQPEDAVQ